MATSDYPGRVVLLGFFVENGNAGSRQQREQFSQELFDAFNDKIVEACAAINPPLDPSAEIRATIAVMAKNSPGNTKTVQAKRAVQGYVLFRGI